jgi:hypothetical protein
VSAPACPDLPSRCCRPWALNLRSALRFASLDDD